MFDNSSPWGLLYWLQKIQTKKRSVYCATAKEHRFEWNVKHLWLTHNSVHFIYHLYRTCDTSLLVKRKHKKNNQKWRWTRRNFRKFNGFPTLCDFLYSLNSFQKLCIKVYNCISCVKKFNLTCVLTNLFCLQIQITSHTSLWYILNKGVFKKEGIRFDKKLGFH